MRILGLGVDLAEVERVERLIDQYPRFAERVFTAGERAYASKFAHPARRYAARFAAKEAVMKSLGVGWRGVRWTDIEVTGGGPPKVRLFGTAAALAERLGVSEVLVTITHTDKDALVMAVAVGAEA